MKFRRKIFKIVIPFILFLFGITTCLNTFSIIDNDATNRNLEDIKYKETPCSATNSIWYRVWGYNETDSWDMGTSVAYDSGGNYYMVGRSSNSKDVAFLVKYDKSGNYKWNKTWHGEGFCPECNDIAVDSSDNVYVTGSIEKDGDLVINTLKFNKTGGLKWNSTAGSDFESGGAGIAIGPDNYVYVTGYNYTMAGDLYVVLLKYNMTTGNIVDLRSYSGVGSTSGMGEDIAIDSSKNIYIVGTNQSGGIPNEILLLKINSTMDLNWSRSWKNPYKGSPVNQGYGVDVDSNGDIYIVGLYEAYDYFPPYYYHDGVFLKYNDTGHLLWEKILHNQYNNTGLGDIYIYQDRIYICGFQGDYDDADVLVLEYNTTGGLINKISWGGTADDSGWGITVRNPSDIVIVGRTSSYASGFPADAFLLNYPPSISPPGSFTLDSNAGDPDKDGNFNLTWSKSIGADNYSVYRSNNPILNLDNCIEIKNNITDLNYTVTGMWTGTHYFVSVAYNLTGFTLSNYVQVNVSITPSGLPPAQGGNDDDDDDDDSEDGIIPSYDIYLILILTTCISLIYYYKKLKK